MNTLRGSDVARSRTSLGQCGRASALAGLLASLAFSLAAGPAAAQVVVTPVALSGGTAPAGGNYLAFGSPVVNASGQVAFQATLNGSSSQGVFVGAPGSLQAAALSGDFGYPLLNASGQVGFFATTTTGTGLLVGSPGSIQAAALAGDAAPAGGNYTGFFGRDALNASGRVAFEAGLTGGSSSFGVFAGTPGSMQAVALVGATAPPGGNYSGVGLTGLNASGQVALQAGLTGGSAGQGLFVGTPGSLQTVALQGAAAPAGGNYASISISALNDSGQVAFLTSLIGGSANMGIFAGAPGSVHTVALQGTPAPAGGNYVTFTKAPLINASGQVAFPANLGGGSSPSGIFVGAPGSVQPVALEGMLAPDGNGATYGQLHDFVLNGSGEVAFTANLSGASAGLYAGSPGAVIEIVRLGDQIDFGDGSGLHTINNIVTPNVAGLDTGLSLNDSGELVYVLSFTDGTSGIFESQITGVPEPSSVLLTFAGLLAVARYRKRLAR